MTPLILNQAQQIAFIVTGKDKAEAVWQVQQGQAPACEWPAKLIQTSSDNENWYIDIDASKQL